MKGEELVGNTYCITDDSFRKKRAGQADRERMFHLLLLDPKAHFMHGKLVHEDTSIILSVLDRYDLKHAFAMLRMKFDTIFAEEEASNDVAGLVGRVKDHTVSLTCFFEEKLGKRVIIAAVIGKDGFYVREMFRNSIVRRSIGKCTE